MARWHLPISLVALLASATLALLTGCEEDPAEAMLKQARQGGGAPPPPPPPAAGDPGGAPPAAAPPAGDPGAAAGSRGLPTPPPGQEVPAGAETPEESGPSVTVSIKEIKPPAPRFVGKGRYDFKFDVTVDPPMDEAVWKLSALDESGKVVGTQEQQIMLLHDKPRTLIINDFYCTAKPVDLKMEIALDENGQPKKADPAGGGVGNSGRPPSGDGGSAPPSGVGQGGGGDGRGAGGGGGGGGGDDGGGDGGE